MPRDDIDHIPSIVPGHERDEGRFAGDARSSSRRSKGAARTATTRGSGSGVLARLVMTVALVVAAVACAWAWQLQQQLGTARQTLDNYEERISDLEARLSDTDEGMSQNAAVQAAKIRDLDSEIRKLWDNVWKKSKERLSALEATTGKQTDAIAANDKAVKALQGKLSSAEGDLAKLRSVSGDLSRLSSNAQSNQTELERLADALNKAELDVAKLNRQVQSNTEGLQATDAFRRQVNSSINNIEASIRALQAKPSL